MKPWVLLILLLLWGLYYRISEPRGPTYDQLLVNFVVEGAVRPAETLTVTKGTTIQEALDSMELPNGANLRGVKGRKGSVKEGDVVLIPWKTKKYKK